MEAKEHDNILVEIATISTKVDRLISDVRELKDNVAQRVSDLEHEKADKTEVDRFLKESEGLHRDYSKRIRFLERGYWIAVGALAIIDMVLVYLLNHHGS